jgi:hypothetical protein
MLQKSEVLVGFDEVSEFVHDHVVNDKHRRLEEMPVEIHAIADGAGTPAVNFNIIRESFRANNVVGESH